MTTRGIPRIRSARKERQWSIVSTNGTVAAASHAGQLAIDLGSGVETAIAANLHNVTASALRINVNYRMTTANVGEEITVICAIAWVSQRAFTTGGTALPSLDSDHYDYMFWDQRTIAATPNVATDTDDMPLNSMLKIRNDSMRKQNENAQVLAIIFRAILLQPSSLQVFVGGRTLFLLP